MSEKRTQNNIKIMVAILARPKHSYQRELRARNKESSISSLLIYFVAMPAIFRFRNAATSFDFVQSKGVLPSNVRALILLPFATRYLTASKSPVRAASCSGVHPALHCRSTISLPAWLTRNLTTLVLPLAHALCSGVQPKLHWVRTLDPCATRSFTTRRCPFRLAKCKGASPSILVVSRGNPDLMRNRATSHRPFALAAWSSVHPFTTRV